jgi:aspartate aminotransferase
MKTDSELTQLTQLREEAARVTRQIIQLIAARNDLAKRIGQAKSKQGLPMEDERVEDALLNDVLKECERSGVDTRAGLKVLTALLSESKRVQGVQSKQPPITHMMIFAKALELQHQGKKLVRLDVGEPDFHPPQAVLEACSEALFSFKTHYTESRGIPELVSGLQAYLKRKHQFSAKTSEVMVTPGGRFAVYAALASTVKEGDSVIIPEPNWPAYKESAVYIGAKPITIHTTLEEGWEPSVEAVKAAIKPNTRAIVLSYPSNPTGKMLSVTKFKEILGVANDKKLTVISDEIYTDYVWKKCPSILDGGADNFILTSSFSKSWAMTGFRMGYAVSSEQTINRMLKILSLMITSAPEFIQYGAIKALDADKEVQANAKAMLERIEVACRELSVIHTLAYYKPDGAMYVFVQSKDPKFDSTSFAMKLLQEKGVTVSPGGGFGDYPACFRISLGQSKEVVAEGIRKIGELID